MSLIKQFNPGEKSWKIYAKELLSINGDDLILKPHENNNLILEPSNGNVIVNSDISINGNIDITGNTKISNINITNFAQGSIGITDKSFANLSSAIENTIIGWGSGYNLNSATQNTAIGSYTLYAFLNGNYNIAIGYGSPYNLNYGNYNVYIGNLIAASGTTGILNEIVIGSNITGQGSNTNTIGNINQITKTYLGYLKLGCLSNTSDYVEFGHNTLTDLNSYALAQSINGDTILNAAAAKKIYFRIYNNSNNEITYDGTTLDLSGITLDVNTINASQLNFNGLPTSSTNLIPGSGRLWNDNGYLKII